MPGSKQQTLDDVRRSLKQSEIVKGLNQTQLNIVELLKQGYYPAFIADRLKISRSYVSRTTRMLADAGLIVPNPSKDPLQGRAGTFTITDRMQALLFENNLDRSATYTLCIPHHIKLKYPILHMKNQVRLDGWKFSRQHATHIKSWKPKGPERHLFHIDTKHGRVGIEFHGKSILAYRVGHDHIMADSVEGATRLAAIQIQEGVDLFIREQSGLGTKIELGRPDITDTPHYAFESEAVKAVMAAGEKLTTPGIWADSSPEGEGRPKAGDIETKNPAIAAMVDRGLRNAMNIEGIVQAQIAGAIPEFIKAMDQRIGPLQEDVENLANQVKEGNNIHTSLINILKNTVQELENLKEMQQPTQLPPLPEKEDLNGMYQ